MVPSEADVGSAAYDESGDEAPAKAREIEQGDYETMHKNASAEKTLGIEEANVKLDVLKADIETHTPDVAHLTKKIAAHEEVPDG